jgi:predicted ATPase/DNA-binding NarL/FixJ family response regulator
MPFSGGRDRMTSEALITINGPAQLPAEVTTFIGRRRDLRRVRELMTDSRLVTLTGFGGIGKTRLALRVADELRRAFPDGVYLAQLGALNDPDGLAEQIATALGVHVHPRQSPTISIIEYLRKRSALLVLDNCEHVVEGAALLADTVLRSCPRIRILATSREALRIDGEAVHPLAPLTVPAADEPARTPLHQFESVQLFLDRAGSIVPDFGISKENREEVAAICRRLEGIPLAIELAAARLRALSLADLDRQLTDRWEVLSHGSRVAPYRQSTMAACIEWSYQLCTPAERRLWAKAAVFIEGFELDAALAVCSDPDEEEPIADTLGSLVEKSVLATVRYDSTNRLRMLAPIRQRGLAELAQLGIVEELRSRHTAHFVGLIVRAHDDWLSPRQPDWIHRLRREDGNVRGALERCATRPGEAAAGVLAAANLLEYGMVNGRIGQGRRWLERVLAQAEGQAERDTATRVRALRTACWWATMQGDLDTATSLLEEARSVAPNPGGEIAAAALAQTSGLVAMYAGDVERAEQLLGEAADGFRTSGDDYELALTCMLLAIARGLLGDPDGALACHQDCLAITEPAGELWLRSWSLFAAGLAMWARGDADAGEALKEALRLKRPLGDRQGIGSLLEALAWLVADSDPGRAAVLMGAAQNEWDKAETSFKALPGFAASHRRCLASIGASLGDRLDQEWSRGRSLDQQSAINLALDERPTPSSTSVETGTRVSHQVITRRQRQVAELVSQGLSNQEIADALVISRRTAEAHVEHILTKLGFTSRTQIAAWMHEDATGQDEAK